MKVKQRESTRTLIPEGVHIATCYSVIDLGSIDGKHGPWRRVRITWEFGSCLIDAPETDAHGKPLVNSREYTADFGKSKPSPLRKDLEAWRGRAFTSEELDGFELKDLLAKTCQIQIVHEKNARGEGPFDNVQAIMALPAGAQPQPLVNPTQYFSFDDCSELPKGLPDFLVEKIQKSHEWKALTMRTPDAPASAAEEAATVGGDDNLPF